MPEKPLVSIVLGSYNRFDFLKLAIESARAQLTTIPHEIIVVDGGSDDGSVEWLVLQKDIITIVQHNRGEINGTPIRRRSWGYFMNLAFRSAQSDNVLMMSDDTIFHADAIQNGLTFLQTQLDGGKKVGAIPFYFHDVGIDPDHTYKISVLFGLPFLNHGIYRKEALVHIGYADETTYEFFAADADICYRIIHAGYEVLPCETALMLHCPYHPLRHVNTPSDRWMRDVTALVDKWSGVLIQRPATILHGYTDTRTTTYVDESHLARVFDEALLKLENPQPSATQSATHTDVRLDQLDNRLQSLLSAVRYNIRLNEQTMQRLDQAGFMDTRPWYRKAVSKWAIFAPLRKIKSRLYRG